MSKKMKGVALDPSRYGGYEDAKAKFKHQTLIQDFRELEKEAEAMRNKLKATKQKKLTLLAEVRFLRRRYQHLLINKATKPLQGRELVQPQDLESQQKSTLRGKTYNRKKANLQNLPKVSEANQKKKIFTPKEDAFRKHSPVLDLNQKDRLHSGKEATLRNTTPVFDLNPKEFSYSGNKASFRNTASIFDLNKERLYSGKETGPQNMNPTFDLNQMERTYIGREDAVRSRAPIFDLNQISGEEELQDNYEPLRIEEPKKFVIRGGTDEQHNDMKLSACRNVGNRPNRSGKRKITWQDQVALRV
ncbi:Protein like [Actinidia chinensis var. chinensis]|uniref:Protein like n=1 Tax=Actinidia chinensis var. chinensis TaxID=1590841 RepID=A0A2R6S1L4_ACTCC|nr:Protein like [Actinidia chinensis var. chinensis]